ncbi:MAG: TolC family protein [Woeseiaceae bacterium]|nr:TolC family protein [Woeseiaceae bacterium]
MLFFRGRTLALMFFTTLLAPVLVSAQQGLPLTLAEAERLALEDEPGYAALRERAGALGEQAVVSGQLPDPTLRIGLANFPIQSGGFSTEGMTQALLAYRQSFPSGKSRDYSNERFASLSLGMNASADARARDVRTNVRKAWLEAYYWQKAREIVTGSRPFFADLATITRSLYSVGRKTQHDVLRSELELSRLDDRLIEINRNEMQAKAALSEWLGENASRPIAETLPEWEQVPPLDALRGNLDSHPFIAAADARIAASEANVVVAEEKKKPGWALDLAYGYREGYLPNGDPRSDFVSLSVTMELPFFSKNRQDRSLAAALRERSASKYERTELVRHLSSLLDAEFARWQDLTRRTMLFESLILELAESRAESALLAYQSDAGDFADVMRGYIDELDTRLDHLRLKVERAQSYAVLANLGGLTQ